MGCASIKIRFAVGVGGCGRSVRSAHAQNDVVMFVIKYHVFQEVHKAEIDPVDLSSSS